MEHEKRSHFSHFQCMFMHQEPKTDLKHTMQKEKTLADAGRDDRNCLCFFGKNSTFCRYV